MVVCWLALAVGAPLTGFAWTLNGDDPAMKGWNTKVLRVSLATGECPPGLDMRSLVLAAMDLWSHVDGAEIRLELAGDASSKTTAKGARAGEAQDSPVVVCDTDFKTTTSLDVNSIPGVTGISVDRDSRRVAYAYTILNTQRDAMADIATLDLTRVLIVITHELGHILGLGHSTDPRAIMYPDVTTLSRATLSDDDVAGLRHLYPPGGTDDGGGCGTIADVNRRESRGRGDRRPPSAPSRESLSSLANFLALLALCALALRYFRRATKNV